jgi:signal transduction histidine kinase
MFRSLRWKFTAWYVATSVLAIVVVGFLVVYAESRALDHRLDGSIRSAGDAVRAATAANLQGSFAVDPLSAAAEAVETVAAHGGLHANDVHVVLLDPNGLVAANPEDVDVAALGRGASLDGALKHGESWHTTKVYDSEVRVKTFPLTDHEGRLIGFVQAAKSVDDNNAALVTLLLVMLAGGFTGLLLLAIGGFLVAGRAIEPVRQGYERQRQFVADASHELRTPLSVILTNTGTLIRHQDHDPAIADIDTEARYMARLLDRRFVLANGDQARLSVRAAYMDLSEVARSAARSWPTLANGKALSFRQDMQEGVFVNADPDLCREAIAILLDNAAKYTQPPGEVLLATSKSGNDALVEVRDTGIGMTKDELVHATDRFFRSDRARSRSQGGSGLGLSIARELMAALHGTLELESEPGRGTTARLRLRLAPQGELVSESAERLPYVSGPDAAS